MNQFSLLYIAKVCCLTLLGPGILLGQSTLGTANARKFDQVLNFFSAEEPGGAVLVAREGKVVYQKAFGKANLELNIDATLKNKFAIASVTKPFTAVTILKLAEEGKLSLKDDITRYLKEFPNQGPVITIEHLLTHTSGIPNYNDDFREFTKIERHEFSRDQFFNLLRDKPANFPPGSEYRYNNSGYLLLGYIIEIVSGKPYGAYLKDEFFEPLGMNDTELNEWEKVIVNRAAGYDMLSANRFTNRKFESDSFSASSVGGLVSTVHDLHTWYDALMSHKIVGKENLESACVPYRMNDGKLGRTGSGWFTGNLLGSRFIAHDGRSWGAAASLVYFPDEKVFVVALSNCGYASWDAGDFFNAPFRMAAIILEKEYSTDLDLDSVVLESYAAVYQSDSGESRIVETDGKQLYLRQSNERVSAISAHGKDLYYVEDTYETLRFELDSQGRICGLVADRGIPVIFKRASIERD